MFSVIIPWCNRHELGPALAANRHRFERHGVEIVVVNAGGDADTLMRIVEAAHLSRIRAITLPGADFSRSLCLNIGSAVSQGEFLFFLDADIILSTDLFESTIAHLESGTRFVTVEFVIDPDRRGMREPTGPNMAFLERLVQTREYFTVDGRRAEIKTTTVSGSHPGDGLVLLTKRAMYDVGGLNSGFVGWGFEDTDLQLRLQFLLELERITLGEVIHIPHFAPRSQRLGWQENYRAATENYSRGHYLGTLETDTHQWRNRLTELTTR
jgi:hypothetical protein